MASPPPKGFGAREPFAVSHAAERAAFFAAAQELIAPALDGTPLDALDARERQLLDMALTFAQIALSMDLHGSGEDARARMSDYIRILRSAA